MPEAGGGAKGLCSSLRRGEPAQREGRGKKGLVGELRKKSKEIEMGKKKRKEERKKRYMEMVVGGG